MTEGGAAKLLETARGLYNEVASVLTEFASMSPFELLVSTIISQNTSWRNVRRAMENIKRRGLLSIEKILEVDPSELEEALRPAGLQRVKAKRIKGAVRALGGSGLEELLSLSSEVARSKLMGLPGVGRKTADILLAFKAGAPVIPVDTHIERIAKRLGLVDGKAGYEEVRAALESFVPPEERALFHLALIEFGREVCRARKPLCRECPLRGVCRVQRLTEQR